MRDIPIGVQSFIKLREMDLCYIDKTRLIDDILNDRGTEAFLYTRPRRFGKSLNLSMLDAYLNMRHAGNTWFDGLAISDLRPDDPVKNSLPVIYIDLKRVGDTDYDVFLDKVRLKMSDLYTGFRYLLDSDAIPSNFIKRFQRILDQESSLPELSNAIMHLSVMLEMHHGKKVVILIDEYDDPLNSTYSTPVHGRVLEFVKDMLSSALKGNDSLMFAVITDVMQISKESIFSGLNHLMVNNVFSTDSDEMFGFTPKEVKGLCAEYGHPEKFEEAREWYDGYRFGDAEIYNPWSILNYVHYGFKAEGYWAGTSGNSIIDTLLDMADGSVYSDLRALGEGKPVVKDIDTRISYADMTSVNGIYCVMVLSGYLKAVPVDHGFALSIPNTEMFDVFGKMVADRFDDSLTTSMRAFCRAVLTADTEAMSGRLTDMMVDTLSFRVFDHEHSYQAFLVGILMNLGGRYELYADGERGKGYFDILLRGRGPDRPNVLIELKRVRSNAREKTMVDAAVAAIDQVRDRDYSHGLTGRTLVYGIAFRGKDVRIVSEDVTQ